MSGKWKKYVICLLSVFLLSGMASVKVQAQPVSGMNLYGIYVDSSEKGDSVLMESQDQYLLMDLGMYSHLPAICGQLNRLGVTHLDLYISHLHVDHVGGCEGDWLAGLKYLAEQGFVIDTLYLPDPSVAPESGSYPSKYEVLRSYMDTYMGGQDHICYLTQGSIFQVGDVQAMVLGPAPEFVSSIHPQDYANKVPDDDAGTDHGADVMNTYYENNCSLITMFSCQGTRYLTTGDMLKDEAADMVSRYGEQLSADIYKIAHHGTATGNSTALMDAVSPTFSFAQNAGYDFIDTESGKWRFENVCNVTSRTGIPFFISNEGKTLIFHTENGKIDVYAGDTVDTAKKFTGWVGVYGADGTNRKKDFYYLDEFGEPLTGVQKIGKHYFLFTDGGKMTYGDYDEMGNYNPWKVYSNGRKRYFSWSESGNLAYMAASFCEIDGKLYHFGLTGLLTEGSDAFEIREIGYDKYGIEPDSSLVTDEIREVDGLQYYFQPDGKMACGKLYTAENGETYYFGTAGARIYNHLATVDGKRYYCNSEGVITENEFVELNGKRYYFQADGTMAKKQFIRENGKYRYFGKYGTQVSGQEVKMNGKTYYLDEEGYMVRGTMYDRGSKTYYFDKSGVMAIRKKVSYNGGIYYFGKYGTMVRSRKVRINGSAYYFGVDGRMYRNTTEKIGKYTYEFAADGKMKLVKEPKEP